MATQLLSSCKPALSRVLSPSDRSPGNIVRELRDCLAAQHPERFSGSAEELVLDLDLNDARYLLGAGAPAAGKNTGPLGKRTSIVRRSRSLSQWDAGQLSGPSGSGKTRLTESYYFDFGLGAYRLLPVAN